MAQLSDTQLVILSAACQRAEHSVYPLATKLNGGAAHKVLTSLLGKGLIKEVRAGREDTLWREDKKKGRLTLRATPAAFEALGIDPSQSAEGDDAAPAGAQGAPEEVAPVEPGSATETAPASSKARPSRKSRAAAETQNSDGGSPRTRANSKQAQLIEMLKRPEGASIEEIVAAFSWQAHTVRGAIAGALKKKLGFSIGSEKVDGRGRVYRIVS